MATKLIKITAVPFIGGLPLRFGMTPAQVAVLIGPPRVESIYEDGVLAESRRGGWPKLYYDKVKGLREIDCSDEVELLFDGVDLLTNDDPVKFLMVRGSHPVYGGGTIIFLEHGIAMSDPPNSEYSTICLFSTSIRDKYAAEKMPLWKPRGRDA